MPQALISIDAVNGSNPPNGTALSLGAVVQLNNTNSGGEISYLWEFLDVPEGSLAALSNPILQNPVFTPDVEGTYLIRLKVNAALVSEQIDTVIAAVLHQKTFQRIPAAGETSQENTLRGWAEDVNRQLKLLTNFRGDPGTCVAISSLGASRGNVVHFNSSGLINTGLPEEERLGVTNLALATSATSMASTLYVVEGKTDGNSAVAGGDLMNCRLSGFFGPLVGAPVVGDPVYVSDAGAVALVAGTVSRVIGKVCAVVGADYYFIVNGSAGASTTASNANFLVDGGSTAGLPNAVDTQNLTSALNIRGAVGFDIVTFNNTVTERASIGPSGIGLASASSGIQHKTDDLTIQTTLANDIYIGLNSAQVWKFTEATGALEGVGADRPINNVLDPVAAQDAATKAYVDAIAISAAHTIIFGADLLPVNNSQRWLAPGFYTGTAPTDMFEFTCARAGELSKLRVRAQGGPGGDTTTVTVYKNGVATFLTCALAIGAQDASDLVNTVTVVVGTTISVSVQNGAAIASSPKQIFASFLYT